MNALNLRTLAWVPLVLGVYGYFRFVHELNEHRPVTRVAIQSHDEAERAKVLAKIEALPATAQVRSFREVIAAGAETLEFRFSAPKHWRVLAQSAGFLRVGSSAECVEFEASLDRLPLFEAFAFSPLMKLARGSLACVKEAVPMKDENSNSILGRVRREGQGAAKATDHFVPMAFWSIGGKISFAMKSCERSSDDLFYKIYRTVRLPIALH